MEKQVNYYIHFFNDRDEEDFQINKVVYDKIYSKAAENDNVFKEERFNDETEIDYTLTIYKTDFFEIINDLISNFIN